MNSDDKTFPGERIAKVIARAGLCSRRDAERLIEEGRVNVNGTPLTTAAVNVTARDHITVDGIPLASPAPTCQPRLWRYHKPAGLVVSHRDPQGRPTVFDALPASLPRVVSIGRLDLNTEGLLLLTDDGETERLLELPATGWIRRYRVRAFGPADPEALARLKEGVEIEGVRYSAIIAGIERTQGSNSWLTFALTEGKNREIKRVCRHLGLHVNRLIRVSYGPFALGALAPGEVEEIAPALVRDVLNEARGKGHRGK